MNDDRCEKTMSPHGWQRCVLPDFTCIVMGQSPASKTYNHSGAGLPFFQGKAEFGDLYPTINMYCSQPKKIAKQGATLLSVRAPVGPTNLATTQVLHWSWSGSSSPLWGDRAEVFTVPLQKHRTCDIGQGNRFYLQIHH